MSIHRTMHAIAIAFGIATAGVAAAAPYIPTSDADVLEQLPWNGNSPAERATRVMRALLERDPHNLDAALRLAQIHLERARAESDPRQLGHAQAALAEWWNDGAAPTQVALLRASIRQSSHEFAPARSDLEYVIAHDPSNAQAWLTLATVQQVTGDFDGAARSCARVTSIAAAPIGAICNAALDGVTGNAGRAGRVLDGIVADPAALGHAVNVRTWALTLHAELAERLGHTDDAERWYRASLAIDGTDAYTIAAYADFLLDAKRPADVVALIRSGTPVDGLLLRRTQADRALGAPDAARSAADLSDRFAALRARGDRVHLREEARFTLAIRQEPAAALELALQNWGVQKEPLDARIALECAIAAGQPEAVAEVVRAIDRTHLEGERLAILRSQVSVR